MSIANKDLVRLIKESPASGWDDAWKIGLTPWDSGDAQPALRDLILSNELDLPKVGRALIPGCGRGYDATCITSHLGLDVLAIDISSTAVQAARDRFDRSSSGVPGTKVSFEVADFFEFSVPDGQRFDLIYDYTFFVAIPPVLRSDWGKQISALLRPGGYLITLVFPLNLPVDESGPPFFVKPEHYVDVLGEGWEKVLDKIPENSIPRYVGRERLVVYRKL
ncbi:S-adenosyl-L-methionine-dependent methyltransferase [Imleria badia]|nr:S-adenosyl-L-methionine-dependent methyltransferase [Imleria badia]